MRNLDASLEFVRFKLNLQLMFVEKVGDYRYNIKMFPYEDEQQCFLCKFIREMRHEDYNVRNIQAFNEHHFEANIIYNRNQTCNVVT